LPPIAGEKMEPGEASAPAAVEKVETEAPAAAVVVVVGETSAAAAAVGEASAAAAVEEEEVPVLPLLGEVEKHH
jgi:hypothetical protein